MGETRRIYLDDKAELFVTVDEIDYAWLMKWRWHATWNSTGKKFYATRNTRIRAEGRCVKVYIHKAILDRAGKKQPTEKHTIGDHLDGESSNCTRDNLRWATHSMNTRNVRGMHARQAALRL